MNNRIDPKKHQNMIDRHNFRKAHPGVFARMKKFFTPYGEMEEYRNRNPSPIKIVAPFIPMLLIITVIYGATKLAHSLRISSKERAIAAYVTGTQTPKDDGILTNQKELGALAHAMLKMKLTQEEIGTLIGIRNRLNATDNFRWHPIDIARLVETLRHNTDYIHVQYSGNGEYMDTLLLSWNAVSGLTREEAARRDGVYAVITEFNAHAKDELKVKVISHQLDRNE